MASFLPAIAPGIVSSFLGIREQDLPYKGNPKTSNKVSSIPSPFQGHGHDDDDASLLLSSLTGIKSPDGFAGNTSMKKSGQKKGQPSHVRGTSFAKPAAGFNVGCSLNEVVAQHTVALCSNPPGLSQEGPPSSEKAVDTTDLSFWMYNILPKGKSNLEEESYSDADNEETEQRTAGEKAPERLSITIDHEQADDHTKREMFRARIRESLSFVRMRMEMLQDLSLGEAPKEESTGGGDTSYMSSTSVLLKHARRQAGILHTEEQAVRLQDLCQWFQNIGKTLGDDALGASSKSTLHSQLDRLRNLNTVKDLYEATQESKSSSSISSFELVRHVEHDVRDRLANLYQGKNFLLSHQADVWANGKSELQASGNKEELLHATMERLQKMEDAYETLGTSILESLKEVERMEEDFYALQTELVTNGCPLLTVSQKKKKNKKSSHKGKKKGSSSDSDGMNTGSSRSESSSAQSSSRPANAHAENPTGGNGDSNAKEHPINSQGQNSKGSEENNDGRTESRSSLKGKKKGSTLKIEKKKGVNLEGKGEATNQGIKGPNIVLAEASPAPQAFSASALSLAAQATPFNDAAREATGQVPSSTCTEISPNTNIASSEGAMVGTPAVIEMVHMQVEKTPSSDIKGQVVSDKPCGPDLHRFSEGAGDLLGVQNKLSLSKTSFTAQDGRDVKLSGSVSLQTIPKPKRKSRRLSEESKDEIVQTDDVAILLLEDCDVDELRPREYQATEVKDLLENMKKMRKQLQFWRTKNWADKHTGQVGPMMPPSANNQFFKVDASPGMGMLCYYNPRTGVHVMKNVSDLDTKMQESIMNFVAVPDPAAQSKGLMST